MRVVERVVECVIKRVNNLRRDVDPLRAVHANGNNHGFVGGDIRVCAVVAFNLADKMHGVGTRKQGPLNQCVVDIFLQRIARHSEWHELRMRSNHHRNIIARGPRRGLRVVIAAQSVNVDDVWFDFKLLQPLRNITTAQKRGPLARKNGGAGVVGVAAGVAGNHARRDGVLHGGTCARSCTQSGGERFSRGRAFVTKPAVKVPNIFCNTATRHARALSDMKNVEVFGHECRLFCHCALESRKPRGMIAIDILIHGSFIFQLQLSMNQ